MRPEGYLQLSAIRAAELQREAAAYALRPRRARIRTRLGWTLVELGLRLAQPTARRQTRIA